MHFENESIGLTFDDVVLVPQYSEVYSRADVDLSTVGLLGEMRLPIISSNMDTVTEADMAIAITKAGGRGIFHRFMLVAEIGHQISRFTDACSKDDLILSIGVGKAAEDFVGSYMINTIKCPTICIDVAHGHCHQVIKMIKYIKGMAPETKVIAGNVATKQGVTDLAEAGADIIKVGIGAGSICSTRVVTGHGIPQLSAITECAEAADQFTADSGRVIHIISDGGHKNSGDVAKAIAAGADYVMLGSLFAATDEAPGEVIKVDGKKLKTYRGMSSREVQEQLGKKVAAEGVSHLKPCKGPVADVLHELEWGLRSAFTYSGAKNIYEFRNKAIFRRVSSHSFIEGTPHGLNV